MPQPDIEKRVRQFRQILLWPLQLMPIRSERTQIQRHWELLQQPGPDNPWHEVVDEFTGEPGEFQERHYNEFTTFLPHVQRFLYGEGRSSRDSAGGRANPGGSPMRVFRRDDVVAVRLTSCAGSAPLTLSIAHVDLYFFYDIDIVLLNVEVVGDGPDAVRGARTRCTDSPAPTRRPGRTTARACTACTVSSGWRPTVQCSPSPMRRNARSSWRSSASTGPRGSRRTGRSCCGRWCSSMPTDEGPIRYRLLEYYRMPLMAYLAVDDPKSLSRDDFVRLGLVTAPGTDEPLPYSHRHLADFEQRYCYDRFWEERRPAAQARATCAAGTRWLWSATRNRRCLSNCDRGVLSQFRHQHFLLFLIAHFQRAALLMFSDRLVQALRKLDINDPESVKRFKRVDPPELRDLPALHAPLLVPRGGRPGAGQGAVPAVLRSTSASIRSTPRCKERIYDMNEYLDSDSLRRQANTVVRLTVVTTFGLIGTVRPAFSA